MLAEAAAADSAALAAAADSAEEALACHRDALASLAVGWHSETGCAATDILQRHCAAATDIVAQLHRASTDLMSLRDDWVSRSGDEPLEVQPGIPQPGPPAHDSAEGVEPTPPPANAIAPPATVPTALPWSMPPAPQAAPPQPGGSVPLPDLGGALVGLVAQIAQTLGSYADPPEPAPAAAPAEKPPPAGTPAPRKPAPVNTPTVPSGQALDAVPKGAVPQAQPLAQTPSVMASPPPQPELLAAERPPDPEPLSEAAVAAPAPAAAPEPPPAPEPPEPLVEPKTPCEIAADELPKVGE